MDRNIQEALKKLIDIHELVLNNINETNAIEVIKLCRSFESNLNRLFGLEIEKSKKSESSEQPWKLLIGKTEEEIVKMLNEKYSTARDLAEAFKGFLPSRVVNDTRRGRIKRKQTVIKHILKELKKIDAFRG